MRDAESSAAWVVCPWCDEKKCVGRYNCKQIADYLKTNRVEFDPIRRGTNGNS